MKTKAELQATLNFYLKKMKAHKSGHDRLFQGWCKAYFKDPDSQAAIINSQKMNNWHNVYDDIKAEICVIEGALESMLERQQLLC